MATTTATARKRSARLSAKKGREKLYQMSEGWLELESDPGLFTLLINDFGCSSVEVEEIYDLSAPFTSKVFGFIFLFNVVEERRKRPRGLAKNTNQSCLLSGEFIKDDDFLKEMFFAFQKVPNSCATHAILSVLMNCKELHIGKTLQKLKEYTKDMSPEDKGVAISNMPELAIAHNSHATSSSLEREPARQNSNAIRSSQRTITVGEAFHFVSFVPINGRLVELDGLKDYPIDHGSIEGSQLWTEKFRQLIRNRLERPDSHEIRYNLMAVIPNKCHESNIYLKHMQRNQVMLLKMLQFFRFYSGRRMFSEHNYFCDVEGQKSTTVPSTVPLADSELRVEIDDHSMTFMSVIEDSDHRPPSPAASVSTQSASDAGSEFNFTEDETLYDDDNDDERFIVCRFECDKSPIEQSSQCDTNSLETSTEKFDSKQLINSLLAKFQQFQSYENWSEIDFEQKLKPLILTDLTSLINNLNHEIEVYKQIYSEEKKKIQKYMIDDARRSFDYDEFISTFLAMVSEQGILETFLNQENQPTATAATGATVNSKNSTNSTNESNLSLEKSNGKIAKTLQSLFVSKSFNGFIPSNLNIDNLSHFNTGGAHIDSDAEDSDTGIDDREDTFDPTGIEQMNHD